MTLLVRSITACGALILGLVSASRLTSASLIERQQTYPTPIACLGPACVNPPGSLAYQDMTVIRRESDGKYFRYSKGNNTGDGFNVATAPALRGPWEYAFEILDGPLKSPVGSNEAATWRWAPEIHFYNNQYYLFYGINTAPFNFDLCVATSPTMDQGNWTDHGSMNVPLAPVVAPTPSGDPKDTYVRLDGSLLALDTDPNGVADTKYMVFGSYQFGLYGFPVSDDLLTIAPGGNVSEIIIDQLNTPAPDASEGGNLTEGPYQLAHGNYIYLFYSRGDCCAPGSYGPDTVYRTEVCRAAKADGPTGPYLDRNGENCLTGSVKRAGTRVLYSNADQTVFAPGSVGVINDPDEGLCLYYQYQNNKASARLGFGYNYLEFDDEEWPVVVAQRSAGR